MVQVQSLARVLGGEQRSSSGILTFTFATAAILMVVEFTSQAGSASMVNWMAGWGVLQVFAPSLHEPTSR